MVNRTFRSDHRHDTTARLVSQTDAIFAALADPTRRSVLAHIAAQGGATATEVAGTLPVTRQAVVKHLASLDAAGLVARERVGREVRYTATPGPLTEVMEWVADVGSTWDIRLARLKEMF